MTKQEKISGKCVRRKMVSIYNIFKQKEHKNVKMTFIKLTKEKYKWTKKYMKRV